MSWRQVGRSATSGQFISIAEANRRPATSVIETVRYPSRPTRRVKRRAVRTLTEENQNRTAGR